MDRPTIDPKWVKKLQGREFCQYPGLLDLAHRIGLRAIRTTIYQAPAADNGNVCIVRATVEMEGGAIFEGVGDASPANVSANIAPHLIRMAETRAKARALRDATNVGMAAIEELHGDEADLRGTSAKPAEAPPAPKTGAHVDLNGRFAELAKEVKGATTADAKEARRRWLDTKVVGSTNDLNDGQKKALLADLNDEATEYKALVLAAVNTRLDAIEEAKEKATA
jgi:hypothetical protein